MRAAKKITIEQSIKGNIFVPRKPNYKDERFYYMGIWWNVSSMYKYIEEMGLKPQEFSIDELRTANNFVEVDQEYAMTTATSKPGIIIQVSRNHNLLVDGHHRLHRALVENQSKYYAHYFRYYEQIHFIMDKEGLDRLKFLNKQGRFVTPV